MINYKLSFDYIIIKDNIIKDNNKNEYEYVIKMIMRYDLK
jgi:hypothetical protein